MTEGLKNTIVGVLSAGILTGIGAILSITKQHDQHLVKIDTVLQQNSSVLDKLSGSIGTVPRDVEEKLSEFRQRLNSQEERMNKFSERFNLVEWQITKRSEQP